MDVCRNQNLGALSTWILIRQELSDRFTNHYTVHVLSKFSLFELFILAIKGFSVGMRAPHNMIQFYLDYMK